MTNYLKIDDKNRALVMDRTFAKNAAIVGSREYLLLQTAKKDYPDYTVTRRTIKKKETQEHYAGLTYDYMRDYIEAYEPANLVLETLDVLEQMIAISKCHSKRYPVIKKWFLEKYPEVKEYGLEGAAALAHKQVEPKAYRIREVEDKIA